MCVRHAVVKTQHIPEDGGWAVEADEIVVIKLLVETNEEPSPHLLVATIPNLVSGASPLAVTVLASAGFTVRVFTTAPLGSVMLAVYSVTTQLDGLWKMLNENDDGDVTWRRGERAKRE